MLRLLKFLKKNVFQILLIVVLLIFQANCDLALPDYTSRIINVGVQQGGIEETIPKLIRKSKLEEILLFVDPSERQDILKNYTLVTKKSDEYPYDIL